MQYKPLTTEEIEEKVSEIEELKDPKVKPDPNNVYFVERDHRRRRPEGVHPVASRTASARRRRRGASTRSRSWTWSSTLHDGKYHDVDSSQDAF